jgi:2-hydroxychromene-2-carboxylate isomerase
MSAPVDFYLDFPSAYSYIAVQRIDAIAAKHGRKTQWHVVSLPHVFKAVGYPAPATQVAKWRYAFRDWHRSCEIASLPHADPEVVPLDAKLARIAYWSLAERSVDLAKRFARAVIGRYWGEGKEVRTLEQLVAATRAIDLDPGLLAAAVADDAAKQRLVAATQAAVGAGVFGAPFAIADGEPFWGADRLDHLDRHLARQEARP